MLYEYVCNSCNHRFEVNQGMKDDPIDTCPKCHKKKARRVISGGTGFILKGTGWTPKSQKR